MDAGFCKQKADECVARAQEYADFNGKRVMLRAAEWWMFLANSAAGTARSIAGEQESHPHHAGVFFPSVRGNTRDRKAGGR